MKRLLATASLALAASSGCLAYNDSCQPIVDNPDGIAGYLAEDVFLERPFTRHDNNALGQLAADGLLHAEDDSPARAVLGVVNSGAIRAEGLCLTRTRLFKGPVKRKEVTEIFLFDSPATTVDITEAQLVAMFERSAEGLVATGQPITSVPGSFLHVSSGARVEVDCEKPKGARVVSLQVDNKPIALPPRADPKILYRVAMPTFILNGGDGYGTAFGGAGKDPNRNPVAARKLGGTDARLATGYMTEKYATEASPLREEPRIVFTRCAKPTRPR